MLIANSYWNITFGVKQTCLHYYQKVQLFCFFQVNLNLNLWEINQQIRQWYHKLVFTDILGQNGLLVLGDYEFCNLYCIHLQSTYIFITEWSIHELAYRPLHFKLKTLNCSPCDIYDNEFSFHTFFLKIDHWWSCFWFNAFCCLEQIF